MKVEDIDMFLSQLEAVEKHLESLESTVDFLLKFLLDEKSSSCKFYYYDEDACEEECSKNKKFRGYRDCTKCKLYEKEVSENDRDD